MNQGQTCPCCGKAVVDLEPVLERVHALLAEFGVDPDLARGISRIFDVAAPATPGRGGTYGELLANLRHRGATPSALTAGIDAVDGPQWWLPSLIRLAYDLSERSDVRTALERFAIQRDVYSYMVVEELTDLVVIGLSARPWPIVDGAGRPRFDIENDPIELDVRIDDFARFLSNERRAWHDLGLMPQALVDRPVQIGDTFAAFVSTPLTAPPATPVLLGTGATPSELFMESDGGGWRSVRGVGGLPVIDITWDARELGKLAYYAAAAGVIDRTRTDTDSEVAAEADARYLLELDHRIQEQRQ